VKITVVGAGVVGCAIAHELASRGADVDLLDSRGAGLGATHASAGILAPQIEGHIPSLRRLAACSLAMYDDFIHRIERDSGRRVEYERCGTLQVAFGDSEARQLAEDAQTLRVEGIDCTLLDRTGANRVEPSLSHDVTAALLVPSHGYVAATRLTLALVEAAQARGVRYSTLAVRRIDGRDQGARVITDTTTMQADAVIVACGSWPIESRPSPLPPIKPIRGQLVHLQLDDVVATRVIWAPECYLVPWRDGSVLVGATVEDVGFDERATADGVRSLLNAAVGVLPTLGGARLQEVRVGLRPKGRDELPIIGLSPTMPGVFYALGHYRNGVLLAPLTAALVADLVLDGRERAELDLVRPGRNAEA
jgi:glycine oxidase